MPTGDEPCIIYDGLLAKQDNSLDLKQLSIIMLKISCPQFGTNIDYLIYSLSKLCNHNLN